MDWLDGVTVIVLSTAGPTVRATWLLDTTAPEEEMALALMYVVPWSTPLATPGPALGVLNAATPMFDEIHVTCEVISTFELSE